MQRYHIKAIRGFGSGAWPEYIKGKTGAWVKYAEAQAEIARLKAEVERLKQETDPDLIALAVMEASALVQDDIRRTARNAALEEAAKLMDVAADDYKQAKGVNLAKMSGEIIAILSTCSVMLRSYASAIRARKYPPA